MGSVLLLSCGRKVLDMCMLVCGIWCSSIFQRQAKKSMMKFFETYLSLWIEHYLHVRAVSHTKLLTKDNHLTFICIPDKSRTWTGTKNNGTLRAVINKDLVCLILNVYVAFDALLELEGLSLDLTIVLEQKFVILLWELVVFRISSFSFVPAELFLLRRIAFLHFEL